MKALNLTTLDRKYTLTSQKTIESFNHVEKRMNQLLKRIIFHIAGGILSLATLIYYSLFISGFELEFFFLGLGSIYCLSYCIITSIILDKLIENEMK